MPEDSTFESILISLGLKPKKGDRHCFRSWVEINLNIATPNRFF
ncbi:MAG: hypothetical protein AAFR37_08535 [Cyanobacteria bacterium J06628_3]